MDGVEAKGVNLHIFINQQYKNVEKAHDFSDVQDDNSIVRQP